MKKENKKVKKPWPTKDAMKQVYEMKLWGDNNTAFYSGDGSHLPEIVDSYILSLTHFLTSFESPITVCDLGCGDFNIGRQLTCYTKKYIAIDVVPELIKHNKEAFKANNLKFECLDIAKEELPKGDCVILRQVLQHLSNSEVNEILNKLSKYNFLVLTEHIPQGNFTPNLDIISGQGIRLKKQSGLDILSPPFNFKVKTKSELLSINLKNRKGKIVTTVFEL